MRDGELSFGACGIALKEWSGICCALGDGRQTILLRKGGVAEENGVFRPEHPRFWLYPTQVHEQQQGLRDGTLDQSTRSSTNSVFLDLLAEVQRVWWVDRLELVNAISEFHIWTEDTIRKRFDYRRPGLWVLAIRVYRSNEGRQIPELPQYAGCKSWVPLDVEIPMEGLAPVLNQEQSRTRLESLASVIATRREVN